MVAAICPRAARRALRAPELRVRLLELAVGVGQLARRLAHARLEPRGQVLEARQHAVEAPGEEAELAAPRHAHACAQLARLGAAHDVHERGHGASHARSRKTASRKEMSTIEATRKMPPMVRSRLSRRAISGSENSTCTTPSRAPS